MKIFLFNWFKKFMSILVSGKMLSFAALLSTCSYLIWHGRLESVHYRDIIVATIAIITMRGVVEIVEIRCKGGKNHDLDNSDCK